ncbi:tetratricopeptide repeat protein [Synechococcus elongatus IITB4]|uniref:O-linked N-acetylglucosamine transferase, SPINDLY family protein n=1 Tax=Synechococcus elongatus TaxID=32046 RepID=UPI0030D255CB
MTAQESYQNAVDQWSLSEYQKAIQYFKKAVRSEPSNDHYWYALGGAYHTQKKYRGARFCFKKSLEKNPNQIDTITLLCEVCYLLKDYKAVIEYSSLVEITTINNVDILYKIALSFKETGNLSYSGKVCAQILETDDSFWQAKLLAAEVLRIQGYVGEARALILELIDQKPKVGKFWNELGVNEIDLVHEEEALAAFRKAEEYAVDAEKLIIGSNYLFEFSSRLTSPQEILEAHLEWAKKYSIDQKICSKKPLIRKNKSKQKINIAYLSGDFRTHSVSYFIQGVLDYHDRDKFNVILLSNTEEDEKTKDFKGKADTWIDLKDLDSEKAVLQIKDLDLDVLVDLSGHTGRNKLNLLSCKLAPVQITYIGYFATTGLSTIDYWITDKVIHPNDTEELSTETIIRLPRCYVAYTPLDTSPEVLESPAVKNRYVTFGSFVASRKISDYSIILWSSILNFVCDSKLFIKNRSCRSLIYKSELLEKFELCGVDRARIILNDAKVTTEDHLAMYGRVDIALDTYPASGCTTTAEALWMGVPVLTRIGDLMVSRNSASLLHALNLQDWIAETDEEYIEKGVLFAQSIDQLVLLRQGMRERFIQSELYDSQDLTRHLENFYSEALAKHL